MKVYILVNIYKNISAQDYVEGVFLKFEDADKLWNTFDDHYQEECRIQEYEVKEGDLK